MAVVLVSVQVSSVGALARDTQRDPTSQPLTPNTPNTPHTLTPDPRILCKHLTCKTLPSEEDVLEAFT